MHYKPQGKVEKQNSISIAKKYATRWRHIVNSSVGKLIRQIKQKIQ